MRVAIVSYYTPPQPAIASHRVLRLTRALLAAGHEVCWVTADADRFATADLDHSLGALVPAAVTVYGIDGQALITKPVAGNLWEKVWRTVAWHVPRKFAYPDSFLCWARMLKRRLPALLRDEGVDAVVVCCSPHNQILALPALRRAAPDVDIFVDYRDLLSGNPWNPRPTSRQTRRVLELERRMLRHADVLFTNTEPARARFLDVVGAVGELEVECMRNAADYDLARDVAELEEPDLGPGVHLGFFGTLFPRRRLRPLLEAMATIATGPSEHLHKLVLHVYCDPLDSAQLLREDLAAVPDDIAENVHRHDYLSWTRALRTMQAMDGLVLVNGPYADDTVFVPGKLYDYLMACRPVLFLGHPGEAGDIVARTSGPEWCHDHRSPNSVAERLRSLLDRPVDAIEPKDEFAPATAFAPLLQRLT